MTKGNLGALLRSIRALAQGQETPYSDGQLLEQFALHREEAAFAGLVKRHGPMVLGICRRITGHLQDAEDAFQATFLVLARKAGSIRRREAVAGWLHGVAYHVAWKARKAVIRRQEREKRAAKVEATGASAACSELQAELDKALERLPEKYRTALVLCYYQGQSVEEAARELDCPRGTIASRLAQGRELLRRRLARRGLALSTGALTTYLLTGTARAGITSPLLTATVQAGMRFAAGKAAGVVVSPPVAALVMGGMRSMFLNKTKAVAFLLLALGGLVAGVSALAHQDSIQASGASVYISTDEGKKGLPPAAELQKAAEPFHPFHNDKKLQQAIGRAKEFLKKAQTPEGHWEINIQSSMHKGGWSSLALLALLKSGVPKDDPAVQKGLQFLRTIKPTYTYTVSLQTAVFANAEPKKDMALIKRNVAWLLDSKGQKKFQGWSYQGQGPRTDNSNTQFAVMALHDARQAGVKIDPGVWKQIQDYYLASQMAEGGWTYDGTNAGGKSFTMTSAGICGLAITGTHMKNLNKTKKELDKASQQIGRTFTVELPQRTFYSLLALGRAGRLSGIKQFPGKHDWFKEGATYLLRTQREDGSWQAQGAWDQWKVVSTSMALLFCAQGK